MTATAPDPADGPVPSSAVPTTGSAALGGPTSRLGWALQFGRSLGPAWRHRRVTDGVERFCLFLGYPRSGHSLVGSLLNAHPEVLIAHELDAVGYVAHHFGRRQIFGLLVERDREFAAGGRRWMGYDYVVPGQFQGRFTELRVIGDKRARTATYRLGRRPGLLEAVRRVAGVPLRVVHVTRNPFDNVVTMARRTAAARHRGAGPGAPPAVADLDDAIDRYGELCRYVERVRARLAPEELHELPYESFVADPATELARLCAFLGVEAEAGYLSDCARVVWPQTRPTREALAWAAPQRQAVETLVATHGFLGLYGWDR